MVYRWETAVTRPRTVLDVGMMGEDEGMIYLNLLDECTNPDQDCEVIIELDNEAIETLIQGLQAARAMRDMYRRENP